MFSALLDLVYPAECVGCDGAAGPLCARCRGDPVRATAHAPDPCPAGFPPTWAAARYDGAIRTALLSYKERGRRDLAPVLGTLLGAAVRAAAGSAGDGVAGSAGSAGSRVGARTAIALVPIPSGRAAARARGGDHVARIARAAAHELRRRRASAVVVPALRAPSTPTDAVGLSAAERLRLRTNAFRLSPRASWPPAAQVVIVDDLVTTGATLVAAARALEGRPVRGAAVIAATVRRQL